MGALVRKKSTGRGPPRGSAAAPGTATQNRGRRQPQMTSSTQGGGGITNVGAEGGTMSHRN